MVNILRKEQAKRYLNDLADKVQYWLTVKDGIAKYIGAVWQDILPQRQCMKC